MMPLNKSLTTYTKDDTYKTETMKIDASLLSKIEEIAKSAGQTIMEIYERDFDIYEKSDQSPLTEADLAANTVITEGLQELDIQYPLLSEESSDIPWKERQKWETYWLVDPLDGTKEFIKKNNEFTVNIALIHQNKPLLGVVYTPATDTLYSGIVGTGAFKETKEARQSIKSSPYTSGKCIVMGSRSHQSDAIKEHLAEFEEYELIPAGSSLKFCKVAEGSAHQYPRLGPTCEWDTGAAHAVLKAAGGEVINLETNQPLEYNTKDEYLNPFFLAKA